MNMNIICLKQDDLQMPRCQNKAAFDFALEKALHPSLADTPRRPLPLLYGRGSKNHCFC